MEDAIRTIEYDGKVYYAVPEEKEGSCEGCVHKFRSDGCKAMFQLETSCGSLGEIWKLREDLSISDMSVKLLMTRPDARIILAKLSKLHKDREDLREVSKSVRALEIELKQLIGEV